MLIKQRSQEGNGPVLRVDSGNLLFKYNGAAQARERMTASTIAEIYRQMDYDAVAVGPLDLAAGSNFLVSDASLPWLSANLRDHRGQAIVPGEKIIARHDLTIGVIGLTGDIDPADAYRLVDWREVLPEIVARLQASCDLLVVLSSLSQADNRELAERFPEVHVLLGADRQKGNVAPQTDNRTLTAQTANQGKYLGQLDLTWLPGAAVSGGGMALGNGARRIAATFGGETIPLAKNLPEDPVIAAKISATNEMMRRQQP